MLEGGTILPKTICKESLIFCAICKERIVGAAIRKERFIFILINLIFLRGLNRADLRANIGAGFQ